MKLNFKLKLIFIVILILINCKYIFAVDVPNDKLKKDIDNINNQLSYLSSDLEYEGLYYYKIRELINSFNIPYKVDMIYNNDPYYSYWFGRESENNRLITDKDLNIVKYTGNKKIISLAERRIAENFSLNYICLSEGDMLNKLLIDASGHIKYLIDKGIIKKNVYDFFTRDLSGYKYIGDDETKLILMSMPEFNNAGYIKNESGYYTNYIFLEKNNEK